MTLLTLSPLFLVLFLFLSFLSNLTAANINPSSSLSSTNENTIWVSSSGEFAFGFRQLNNSNLFLLAIWFNNIPAKTIVWCANGNNPVQRGSRAELTTTGLFLYDPKGQPVWQATPSSAIASAAMLDTGNFVLIGNDSSYVWESFKNPTDTILPSQVLELDSMLFSRLTQTNHSKGRFELHFSNGALTLNPIAWPSESLYDPYFDSHTFSVNLSESGYQLVFNESANIYIVKNNGEFAQISTWGALNYTEDYYHRATLDFDGVFTQYAHPKNSGADQSWRQVRSIPGNICEDIFTNIGSGPCGFNSYCSIHNQKPSCDCPPGYVFIDPNNKWGGCVPNFLQGCGFEDGFRDPEELYEIKPFDNVNWPLNDYERLSPLNQTECEKSCLNDCSCGVAIHDGSKTCWKKRLPLSNGRFMSSGYAKVLFKVRKENPTTGNSGNSGNKRKESVVLGAFILGGFGFFNLVLLIAIASIVFLRRKRNGETKVQDTSFPETNLHFFTYKQLEEATDGFKEELGRGSFGIVYKGVLKSGSRNLVAVKKLENLAQEREREFRTEVSAIGRTHHRNLVQLLGVCEEGSQRLLVYEFLSNGTLADFLFGLPRPDWNIRAKIALGIGRGLVYLHEECNVPIIHCDIKPQNILLDEYFTARVSDFGLAKLLHSDQSRTRTMIRGTRGYVAPEWFKNVPVTSKVDVYSFGVMLLEIICCRRSVVMELEAEEGAILTDWAYDCYVEGRLDVLADNNEEAMGDKTRLHRWVMIAIWCIQEDPAKRPTMKMVMQMLEGLVNFPLPPHPSSFSLQVED